MFYYRQHAVLPVEFYLSFHSEVYITTVSQTIQTIQVQDRDYTLGNARSHSYYVGGVNLGVSAGHLASVPRFYQIPEAPAEPKYCGQ